MTRKQHYDAIARIIGNEMALGVNLLREEDQEWQLHLRSVARQLAGYFAQDRKFDRKQFLEQCRVPEGKDLPLR
jgi:hypothetical protein